MRKKRETLLIILMLIFYTVVEREKNVGRHNSAKNNAKENSEP